MWPQLLQLAQILQKNLCYPVSKSSLSEFSLVTPKSFILYIWSVLNFSLWFLHSTSPLLFCQDYYNRQQTDLSCLILLLLQLILHRHIVISKNERYYTTPLLSILHWFSIIISIRFHILTLDQRFHKSLSYVFDFASLLTQGYDLTTVVHCLYIKHLKHFLDSGKTHLFIVFPASSFSYIWLFLCIISDFTEKWASWKGLCKHPTIAIHSALQSSSTP